MHYVHDFEVSMMNNTKLVANVHEYTNGNSSTVDVFLVYPNGCTVHMGQKEYDTSIPSSYNSVQEMSLAKNRAIMEVLQDVDYRLHELARLTEKALYGSK